MQNEVSISPKIFNLKDSKREIESIPEHLSNYFILNKSYGLGWG